MLEVKARFAGEVEVLVRAGERVAAGLGLVIIEGDKEIERLAAMKPATVTTVFVKTGDQVVEGQILLRLD
jgi:biotin carboxyl carrier protein